jgi:hypothetical protein
MPYRRANWDALRSLPFGSITTTYAAVGSAATLPILLIKIQNTTDKDVIISTDPNLAAGNDLLPAGSFTLFDLNSDNPRFDLVYALEVGTTIYAKLAVAGAPTKGAVTVTAFTMASS